MRHAALILAALLLFAGCGAGEIPSATPAPLEAIAWATTSPGAVLPQIEPVDSAIWATLAPWFEHPESREFYFAGLTEIEGVTYAVLEAVGRAGAWSYTLATLAIDETGGHRSYRDEAGAWVPFQNDPWFAVADSPDGQYRIESIGMWHDGSSGRHALDRMRIISLSDGAEMWSDSSVQGNTFHWSPDSRFVSATRWGRTWSESFVVDTTDMRVIQMPGPGDICALEPEILPMKADRGDPYVVARDWESDTELILDIRWTAEHGIEVGVNCTVDVLTGAVEIVDFSAHQAG